ncbi:MAG: FAD-dependent thymidylate synthase [Melioribacteraceae bacterium]
MEQKFEKLESIRVPELDAILGEPFKVLDDGFVRVVDYMGSDQSIVQAARVSYGSGTKKIREDQGLIRYLLRHHHTTPLEMCEIKLHIRVPMDCWRQWIRHRTANVNEYSTRYSLAIDSAQMTGANEWRSQSTSNRQGSGGYIDEAAGIEFSNQEKDLHELSKKVYNNRINAGVAREQARKDLPLSTYTEAYWKIDLHNLLHFLRLRLETNAQLEIRKYSEAIANEIVKKWVPIAWGAFEDYQLNALSFSGLELELLRYINSSDLAGAVSKAESYEWLGRKEDGTLKQNLERIEFEQKLERINISIPWK